MQAVVDLVGCQRAEFEHASGLRRTGQRLQAAILLTSALSIIDLPWIALYFLALVGLILFVWWAVTGVRLRAVRGHAEKIRRLTMIAGGLGLAVGGSEFAELTVGCKGSSSDAKRYADPNYFASKEQPGPKRFVEMLSESAFWSKHLAGYSAEATGVRFLIAVSLTVVMIFILLPLVEVTLLEKFVRLGFVLMMAFMSADHLGKALQYREAHIELDRIMPRMQLARQQTPDQGSLALLFGDYNSVVEAMPLFPDGVYDRNRKKLDGLYATFNGG